MRARDQKPPLDEMGRCESLWLYDEDGTDLAFAGSYVEYGVDEALEIDGYEDAEGNVVAPSHWMLRRSDEKEPPLPPSI